MTWHFYGFYQFLEGISPPPLAQEKGRTRKRAHIHGHANAQGIQNQDLMDKKRVDVAVRDQKSTSGRVWARMVHSMPTRKSPALDADVEAAARLV